MEAENESEEMEVDSGEEEQETLQKQKIILKNRRRNAKKIAF